MGSQVILIAISVFLGPQETILGTTVDERVRPIIDRLCENGDDYAAYKFIAKLERIPELDSEHLRKIKLSVASRLMLVDGQIGSRIAPSVTLKEELVASHPIFPKRNQPHLAVKTKLENAEELFRTVSALDPSYKIVNRFYSNHTLHVVASLETHLLLIDLARNPTLDK